MSQRRNFEKVVGVSQPVSNKDGFDGIMQDMDSLEKEDNPFRLVFGFIKIIFKLFWRVIAWWMKGIIKMIKWLMKRNQPQQPQLVAQ